QVKLTLELPKGWRRRDDISWRVSSWGLRRMGTGGLVLENISAEERKRAKLPETGMALRVKFVGQNGPHAAGKKAGFQQGDIVLSFDERTDLLRETDVLAYAVTARRPGDRVAVRVWRAGELFNFTLPMQE